MQCKSSAIESSKLFEDFRMGITIVKEPKKKEENPPKETPQARSDLNLETNLNTLIQVVVHHIGMSHQVDLVPEHFTHNAQLR